MVELFKSAFMHLMMLVDLSGIYKAYLLVTFTNKFPSTFIDVFV
ncbi:Uncharacterised protein [Pragia fontium]|nr:Uncharacterised protein [Pragia fontium]